MRFSFTASAGALASAALISAAAASAAAAMPKPGLWDVEGRTTGVELGGSSMPEAMTNMIKQRIMSRPAQSHQQCVTAEDLKSAPENLVKSSESACDYERFSLEGGTMDAVAVCNFPQGGSGRMEMSGSYTDDSYETTSVVTMDAGPMGRMTITAEATGTRVGDCD
ncbi:hypothetical protein B5C34_14725 [Pacificimonas flava]|uniref:DUF3617 domain-containing protein n=2 Tax=Pacificimonas TaxID=1960290 RepID=A0A219B0U2_9SPHN|nr:MULTISPECIES: DUF3617 domain-containing protein [Pacificimonas]MBZ6379783.1 DUF3617 domain-containing protein [Pacificimonas aurantium]OWV31763.1 hypothetical protein B5C34_14725 [Pacificimonas flava]